MYVCMYVCMHVCMYVFPMKIKFFFFWKISENKLKQIFLSLYLNALQILKGLQKQNRIEHEIIVPSI